MSATQKSVRVGVFGSLMTFHGDVVPNDYHSELRFIRQMITIYYEYSRDVMCVDRIITPTPTLSIPVIESSSIDIIVIQSNASHNHRS
jgi:hypothetical protein